MAEPDIVERLRRELGRNSFDTEAARDLMAEASAEIERLRGGGWTRLSDQLPPDDGTPFEMRMDGDDARYFMTWLRDDDSPWSSYDLSAANLKRQGMYSKVPTFGGSSFTIRDVRAFTGWWRLLPGGEPPT